MFVAAVQIVHLQRNAGLRWTWAGIRARSIMGRVDSEAALAKW